MGKPVENHKIRYSPEIPFDGVYKWPVRFDASHGSIGINQMQDGKVSDRVLLSPTQVKEFLAFIKQSS